MGGFYHERREAVAQFEDVTASLPRPMAAHKASASVLGIPRFLRDKGRGPQRRRSSLPPLLVVAGGLATEYTLLVRVAHES